MLQQERFQHILGQIKRENAVHIRELAQEIGVSESTVRRDISDLAARGALKKVFGGAVAADTNSRKIIAEEQGMTEKSLVRVAEKRRIAEYAAGLVNDDDFVYIDAGTTTGMLVEYLENRNAYYVTNGIRHALRLAERGFKVCILSGRPKFITEAVVGTACVENMRDYNFTKAFMGANGVDLRKGFTTPDIDESIVKREAVKRAYIPYVLSDSSKFGIVSSVCFAEIRDCCIITDRCPDDAFKETTVVQEV